MSHTPGHWYSDGLRVWAAQDERLVYIASLKFAGDTEVEPEEAQANSDLIAAAPDLLEACKVARECRWSADTMDALNRAIYKAEGRTA